MSLPAGELQWVTIRSYEDPSQARLDSGLLQSAGIPVLLTSIHFVETNPLMANALSGMKLQTPREYSQEALALLEAPFDPADLPDIA